MVVYLSLLVPSSKIIMSDHDSLSRFLFEQLPVRGEIVHLDASWRAALERVDYPPPVRALLGEAMAAAVLLASTLKFEGALTLQVNGNGPVDLLVVQCSHDMKLRGLARWQGDIPAAGLPDLVGDGRLAITLEQSGKTERYQGVVPLEGETLAASLEDYFARSEQLPTRLWLVADAGRAAGMLLQVLPARDANPAGWEHATVLADTVRDEELLRLPVHELLHRLYHEDDVRLFESAPVAFRCSCTRERIANMLRSLGRAEIESVLQEQGVVSVSCEFCGREYTFDKVDAETLFVAGETVASAPVTRQ